MSKWPVAELKAASVNRIDVVIRDLGIELHETASGLRGKGVSSDRTDSLSVTPEKGLWNDHSASEGGDVFAWLEKRQGMDFPSACQFLADRAEIELEPLTPEKARIELDPPTHEETAAQNRCSRSYDALEAAWKVIEGHRPPALERFAQDRGITPENLSLFRIGMAPADLWQKLEAQGVSSDEIMSTGLFREPGHLAFAGYVLFPVLVHGCPVNFIGRATDPAKEAKYLKPKSEHLPDDGHLFGTNTTKAGEVLCIVEGPLDVISCVQAGFPAVALCTTSVTEKGKPHLLRLASMASEVVIIPDHDPPKEGGTRAGLEGAKTTAAFLWGSGVDCYLADLPPDPTGAKVDANSFIREHGASAFAEVIEKRLLFPEWLLGHIDPAAPEKTGLPLFVEALAARDEIFHERFLKTAKERLGIPLGTLRAALKKASKTAPCGQKPEKKADLNTEAIELVKAMLEESTLWFTGVFGIGRDAAEILLWEDEHWRHLTLQDFFKKADLLTASRELKAAVLHHAGFLSQVQGPPDVETLGFRVALVNGILDFHTGEFQPSLPEFKLKNTVGRRYLPPHERLAREKNRVYQILAAYAPTVQKWILGSLLPRVVAPWPGGKHFYLVGPPGTGKSKLLSLLDRILDGGVCHLAASTLAKDSHAGTRLEGSFMNSVSEAKRSEIKDGNLEEWKQVADELTLEVNPKNLPAYQTRNMATPFHALNLMVFLVGLGSEFWRRLSILPFLLRLKGTSGGNDDIEKIIRELTNEELDSVWSEAADIAIQCGPEGFYPADLTDEETESLYVDMVDPLRIFMQSRLSWSDSGGSVAIEEIVETYLTSTWSMTNHKTQERDPRGRRTLFEVAREIGKSMSGMPRRERRKGPAEGKEVLVGLKWAANEKTTKSILSTCLANEEAESRKNPIDDMGNGSGIPLSSTTTHEEREKEEKSENDVLLITSRAQETSPENGQPEPFPMDNQGEMAALDSPELEDHPAPLEQSAACQVVLELLGRASRTRAGLRAASSLPHEAIDAAVTHLLYAGKIVIDEDGYLYLLEQAEGSNS
ncbi:MAG: hypothetical protein CVU65_00830 [Deltaproteobacteria bacterium HGW-Deltaproteobacteria-22]|jgi:DNA primase|nr:MAG: hypothetical protein CVU65_00830 [Deltaproteobacteria bacterium HGW-Deltaproteobacteria-22]